MAPKLFMNPMGYTTRRPANFPALDRRAVMIEAHRLAKRMRPHFANYRAAFAYGLEAAWKSNWDARVLRSLIPQVSQPNVSQPDVSKLIASTRRRPMLGYYGFVGA